MGSHSRSYRMFLTSSVSAVLVSSALIPLHLEAKQINYKDVSVGVSYYDALQNLSGRGIIKGYPDGTFKPNQYVTRGQAAKILALTLGLSSSTTDPGFLDISKTNPYYGYIAALAQKGIINGYEDHTFRPNEPLTRAQLTKLLTIGFGFTQEGSSTYSYKDVTNNSSKAKYVYPLVERKIMNGHSTDYFDLTSNVTRRQIVDLVYKSETYQKQHDQSIQTTISNVTNTSVSTDKGTFALTDSVMKLLNAENKSALLNANAKLIVKDYKVVDVVSLQLNSSKTVLDANNFVISGDITINAEEVTLKNMVISGDLLITEKVQQKLNLEKLVIKGELKHVNIVTAEESAKFYKTLSYMASFINNQTVQSSIKLALTMDSVSVSRIDLAINVLQLESLGTTSIQEIHLSANASITSNDTSTIGIISVNNGVNNVIINARVQQVLVNTVQNMSLSGTGSIENLNIGGTGQVSINNTGPISAIMVTNPASKLYINLNAQIENITLPVGQKPETILVNYGDFKDILENGQGGNSYQFNKPNQGGNTDNSAKLNAARTLNTIIAEANSLLQSHMEGTGIGQALETDRDEFSAAISSAQDVYDNRSKKTIQELSNASTDLNTAIIAFKGKVITAGDPTALYERITEANNLLAAYEVGAEIGQVSQVTHDALSTAITTAENVYADRANQTADELGVAVTALQNAVEVFEESIIEAGDPTALNEKITEATNLLDAHLIGIGVGEVTEPAHNALSTAIDSAKEVYANRENQTTADLSAAETALQNAMEVFEGSIIKAGDSTALNEKIEAAENQLSAYSIGSGVGEVTDHAHDALSSAIDSAKEVYANRANQTTEELGAAESALQNAIDAYKGSIIEAGDPTALNEKIEVAEKLLSAHSIGSGVGEVSESVQDALSSAIVSAKEVYADRANQTAEELGIAETTLQNAIDVYKGSIIEAGDSTALNEKITEATELLDAHSVGSGVGEVTESVHDALTSAITAAETVYTDRANKTADELWSAETALQNAIDTFEGSIIKEGDPTALNQKIAEANDLLKGHQVGAEIGQVPQSAHDALVDAITSASDKVNAIQSEIDEACTALDTAINTFKNEIIKAADGQEYTSKEITNFDYATTYATQAKLTSKPVTVGDFTGNPKSFTIVIGEDRIPVTISWALSKDFPKGQSMGSVVDSAIQDYFYKKNGSDGIMNRTVAAFGFDDTFSISTFSTGSASSFTLEGSDCSYFFEKNASTGTDQDTSKNREFSVSDGTNQVNIILDYSYANMDDMVSDIDNQLYYGGVNAQVEKVDESHFRIKALDSDVNLSISGTNKSEFFE